MSDDADALPEAQTPAELLKLVLDVGKRLTGMTGEWWSREHFRPSPNTSETVVIIDAEAEAAWHRRRAAAQYRDALRLQALRLCADDPTLSAPPPATRDPERDITDELAQWCIDAQRADTPAKPRQPQIADDHQLPPVEETYAIHYASESFVNSHEPPRPWVIALHDPVSNDELAWYDAGDGEAELLKRLGEAIEARRDRLALTWKMGGGGPFGWQALAKRAAMHGLTLPQPERHIDLSDYLWQRLGNDYIPQGEHGRLHTLAKANNLPMHLWLPGGEEPDLIAAGELPRVRRSVEVKTRAIDGVYRLWINGALRTGPDACAGASDISAQGPERQGGLRAGAAFTAMMESDPQAKAAWERSHAKLRAFGEVMQSSGGEGDEADYWQRLQELTEAIREGLRASGDQLAAQGFAPPKTIEDWEHLARIVEIPLETIRSGDLTCREIHACALAWADRQKLRGQFAAAPADGAPADADETDNRTDPKAPYMPADWFKDEFGLTADSLRGQTKRGNLAKTKRGHWNLYSVPDAMRIWPHLVTYGPNAGQ